MSSPPFEQVLVYEYQLRKSMMKGLNEGKRLESALELAMADLVLKEHYFVMPCALSAVGQASSCQAKGRERSRSRGRQGGLGQKGLGKGKGKGVE